MYDEDLAVSCRHEIADLGYEAGFEDGAAGSLLPEGKPSVHVRRVQDIPKAHLTTAAKDAFPNERCNHGSSGMNITDVRGVVQGANRVDLPPNTDLDPTMPWLGMNVQQNPAGPKCPVKGSQSVADTLTSYSSQGPGEDRHVKPGFRKSDGFHVPGSEGDDRLQGFRPLLNRVRDACFIRIDR